jgi:hypothetical protein
MPTLHELAQVHAAQIAPRDVREPSAARGSGEWPFFAEDEIEAAARVLRSGKVNYWTGEEGRRSASAWGMKW